VMIRKLGEGGKWIAIFFYKEYKCQIKLILNGIVK